MNPATVPLEGLRLDAVLRAIKWLTSSGVPFAVVMPDGTKHGDLELAPPAPARKSFKKVNNFVEMFPGYVDKIKSMKAGDALTWTLPVDFTEPECFRSAVAGHGSKHLPRDSYITAVHRDTTGARVEILRVE